MGIGHRVNYIWRLIPSTTEGDYSLPTIEKFLDVGYTYQMANWLYDELNNEVFLFREEGSVDFMHDVPGHTQKVYDLLNANGGEKYAKDLPHVGSVIVSRAPHSTPSATQLVVGGAPTLYYSNSKFVTSHWKPRANALGADASIEIPPMDVIWATRWAVTQWTTDPSTGDLYFQTATYQWGGDCEVIFRYSRATGKITRIAGSIDPDLGSTAANALKNKIQGGPATSAYLMRAVILRIINGALHFQVNQCDDGVDPEWSKAHCIVKVDESGNLVKVWGETKTFEGYQWSEPEQQFLIAGWHLKWANGTIVQKASGSRKNGWSSTDSRGPWDFNFGSSTHGTQYFTQGSYLDSFEQDPAGNFFITSPTNGGLWTFRL